MQSKTGRYAADDGLTIPEITPLALNPRELATVLAALRGWQDVSVRLAALRDIATDGGTLDPLTSEEIDVLCERLNGEPDTSDIPEVGAAFFETARLVMPRPQVLVTLDGGVVQNVEFTGGAVDVEIRGFDTEGSDCEGLPVDDNGQPFYRHEYGHAGDATDAGIVRAHAPQGTV